jgi:transposase
MTTAECVQSELSKRLVPDELWETVQCLIPPNPQRMQGGGRSRVDDRTVFLAIVFVLTSGCSWRRLPPTFGVKVPTVHRRFSQWTAAGLWQLLQRSVASRGGGHNEVRWAQALVEAALARTCEPLSEADPAGSGADQADVRAVGCHVGSAVNDAAGGR